MQMKVKSNHDKKLQKELQHDWENIHEAITLIDNHAAQVVVEEIPILDFTEDTEESVKRSLEEECTLLEDALNTRLKTPPLFEALSKAFNDPE